jgi:hypothetical protein
MGALVKSPPTGVDGIIGIGIMHDGDAPVPINDPPPSDGNPKSDSL